MNLLVKSVPDSYYDHSSLSLLPVCQWKLWVSWSARLVDC